VESSCEYGKQSSGSVKCWEFHRKIVGSFKWGVDFARVSVHCCGGRLRGTGQFRAFVYVPLTL
jgi:hypothetical protein